MCLPASRDFSRTDLGLREMEACAVRWVAAPRNLGTAQQRGAQLPALSGARSTTTPTAALFQQLGVAQSIIRESSSRIQAAEPV